MTTLIAFFIVIVLLVLVHEFGHFWAAKKSGMRVDEFGVGFPPRLWSIKKGETVYSVNALPFGGFVKIYGEDGVAENEKKGRSFAGAPFHKQGIVLLAGVSMNFLFAWILISLGFMIGQQVPVAIDPRAENPMLTITEVLPNSPAHESGLKPGDTIASLTTSEGNILQNPTPESVQSFINTEGETEITFLISRNSEPVTLSVMPQAELVEGSAYAVGIAMDTVGTLTLPVHEALFEGGKTTINVTTYIVAGLASFITEAFVGEADTSTLTGPVGIAGLAGDALRVGFVNFISFTALISIHLAILNLLPIPALDGGRFLFLAIEQVSRRKIPMRVMVFVNAATFVFLISLMLFVTYRDIVRLF